MKLKLLAAVCAFAIGSAASAQITETVTPLVPLSPSDQQILNVQQAERQIQANEQAVEKARAAEKAARQRAAAQARQAKARAEAKAAQQAKLQAAEAEAAAQKQKLQNYQDQMMQMDLESKRLDLEAKRSKVQTEIDLNKVRQQQAIDSLKNQAPAVAPSPAQAPAPAQP